MTTINEYQVKIAEYRKRREKLRRRYNVVPGTPAPVYRLKSRNLSIKIKFWTCKMRRLQKGVQQAYEVDKQICAYFGISARSLHKFSNSVIKRIFCKYCIEHGVKSKFVALYLKLEKPTRPGIVRLSFTRSFITNPDNRTLYHNFLSYMNEMG